MTIAFPRWHAERAGDSVGYDGVDAADADGAEPADRQLLGAGAHNGDAAAERQFLLLAHEIGDSDPAVGDVLPQSRRLGCRLCRELTEGRRIDAERCHVAAVDLDPRGVQQVRRGDAAQLADAGEHVAGSAAGATTSRSAWRSVPSGCTGDAAESITLAAGTATPVGTFWPGRKIPACCAAVASVSPACSIAAVARATASLGAPGAGSPMLFSTAAYRCSTAAAVAVPGRGARAAVAATASGCAALITREHSAAPAPVATASRSAARVRRTPSRTGYSPRESAARLRACPFYDAPASRRRPYPSNPDVRQRTERRAVCAAKV